MPELAAEKLNNEYVRAISIPGKPLKGWNWFIVEKSSWNERDELASWINIGRSFALSLPKKSPKRKSIEK